MHLAAQHWESGEVGPMQELRHSSLIPTALLWSGVSIR
jgi:hypothetical protein